MCDTFMYQSQKGPLAIQLQLRWLYISFYFKPCKKSLIQKQIAKKYKVVI